MKIKCIGRRTVRFERPARIASGAAIVSSVEGDGPIGAYFDKILEDDTWGEETWEKAERKMFEQAVRTAIGKCGIPAEGVDILLGGDLLNQIITANFAARELNMPFLGLYGACSMMSESLLIGSMLIDGGFASLVACAAASHFSTAERQYRFPLEMGGQTVPTAQRTVTGAGSSVLVDGGVHLDRFEFEHVFVTGGVIGRVVDLGITDSGNMGAAMAPAAADTLLCHLADSGYSPGYYDLIVTGDLGKFGSRLFADLCAKEEHDISELHVDCGNIIFSPDQNVDCGGSGCGCSAVTLNGYLLKRMEAGDFNRALFMATGALMSPTASLQGESIPGIAHGVIFERK